ncbi:MAG TPA: nucleotidyl transferase AbiEii/AbiGii toxin family protein [Thermoanaerobaculia bacterium]|nr:nucleotidyl transferase AbiEii/AbiGii toxin family protein [Thermoanaerobaculia bacterium]
MSDRVAAVEVLHAVDAALRELGVRWYVFGAQAAIIWGSPRLSSDVDVTLEAVAPDRVVQTFRSHGFDIVESDPEFIERTRVIPVVHRKSGMPVDLVLAGAGLEEEFLERSIACDVNGRDLPVMSPEDLIATKILAGRAKDLEDVRSVMRARAESLDVERVRSLLALLEQALTRSDLLREFDAEWQKVRQ